MTGQGVVVTDEVRAEADCTEQALLAEMRPTTTVGRFLVGRIALAMAQLVLLRRHNDACRGHRVRHAQDEFDEQRQAAPEADFEKLPDEPATRARRLQQTPEGLDLVIRAWLSLFDDLADPRWWSYAHWKLAENLVGRRPHDVPHTRLSALCQAAMGDFRALEPEDGAGLDDHERRAWAAEQLRADIAARVERLKARRAELNPEAIARDRAEAGERALFDPSPEAVLARKYEAALERTLYRALKEFREVEAAAAAAREAEAAAARAAEVAAAGAPRPDVTPKSETVSEPLGSFFPDPVPVPPGSPVRPSGVPVRCVSGPPEVPGTVGGGRCRASDPPR
jgi:hypothetical protein